MTQSPTPIQAALAEAGRQLHAAFADAGVRVVGALALGHIMSGTPDAARGMIEALTPDERNAIADAAAQLVELSDTVLAATTPLRDAAPPADPVVARAVNAAGILAYALRERPADVAWHLDGREHADLLWIRRGVAAVLRAIDDRLPSDRSHAGLGLHCSVCDGPCGIDENGGAR